MPRRSTLQTLCDAATVRVRRWSRPALLGTLRRTSPISDAWGYDRGTPIDRYYIDRFLAAYRDDIRGRLLEVRDARYATRFGAGVESVDVLDIDPSNPRATIVADLATADGVPASFCDCFLLTQTLQYVRDLPRALVHARRVLRPGGVLLASVPGTQRSDPRHLDTDLWRFTLGSCRALFGEAFGAEQVSVTPFGNMLACIGALNGMAAEELSRRELDAADPTYPVVLGIRATRGPRPSS